MGARRGVFKVKEHVFNPCAVTRGGVRRVTDRLAPGAAQCSWNVGLAARAVAIVVRTGRVVNEGVATVACVCAAALLIVKIIAIVASIVTGASFPIVLEHVAGVRCLRVIKRKNRAKLWLSIVRRLAVRDERTVGLRVRAVLHLSKKPV